MTTAFAIGAGVIIAVVILVFVFHKATSGLARGKGGNSTKDVPKTL